MVRVVLGGEGLAGFGAGAFTDHYVKLLFPGPDGRVDRRTYTVRSWDPATGELTIDFVHHGDDGLAGPWAAAAQPGDVIELNGPGGEYAPDPTAYWHLFAGDASALPAIAASLERVRAGVQAFAFVEIEGPEEEQKLDTPGDLTASWLDRSADGGAGPDLLADAIRAHQLPGGRVHAFVHGEAASVRAVRRHLLVERGVARADLSVSGYWKRGRTEEGWRADKADWQRQVTLDEQAG
jgi:NADPH-dependent ferric siderophore reductase